MDELPHAEWETNEVMPKGYGALKGRVEFRPDIDLTKPIWEQVYMADATLILKILDDEREKLIDLIGNSRTFLDPPSGEECGRFMAERILENLDAAGYAVTKKASKVMATPEMWSAGADALYESALVLREDVPFQSVAPVVAEIYMAMETARRKANG